MYLTVVTVVTVVTVLAIALSICCCWFLRCSLSMLSTNVSHFTSGRPKSRDLKIVSAPLRDELSADFHATTRSGDQMR